ncbi:keratin-associated protein 9-2-like [Mizuhopecten yessoensis]|uniref:keratin-associated protein 9-2-like n=1 Tax=Mizuhopecten yessoensis TaxID=6573 RepID=UPI000B45DAA5|nr:keratin-associated protein 9-2-like [Mizuhopecten yessoensis]
MVTMFLTCLLFILTLAVVQCAGPTCTSSCTAPQTCKWTCTKSAVVIAGAKITGCTQTDDPCGVGTLTDGQCKPGCVAPTAAPTCTSSCTAPQTCHWTCKKSKVVLAGAKITGCTQTDDPCGVGTLTDGQCKPECVAPTGPPPNNQPVVPKVDKPGGSTGITTTAAGTTGKNGSIRLGVSPLMLLCGIFTKLFLYP